MDSRRRTDERTVTDDQTLDAELLQCSATGDRGAFRSLFDRHQRAITDYLYRILGDHEEAQDAVADTFIKVWQGAGGFQSRASVRTWIFRIATHVAIDRLRRRQRVPWVTTRLSDMDERDSRLAASAASQPETAFLARYQRERDLRALHVALGRLPPEDRTLLELRCFENCSYQEISEITGRSLTCIKSRLHSVRQRLKRDYLALRDADELDELVENLAPDARQLLAV